VFKEKKIIKNAKKNRAGAAGEGQKARGNVLLV
jgi:hypothetical protein